MTGSFPCVRLRVGGARGHLFFYRKMVHPPEPPIPPGVLVDVVDRENVFVGRAFYNPRSQIALRLLSMNPEEPAGDEFFRRKLHTAVALRHDVLRLPEVTDAYRVCHSEGDGLSGLVVDRLGPVLSIELFSIGFFKMLDRLQGWLLELFPGARFSARAAPEVARIEGFRLPPPEPIEGVTVREYGVEYRVDFAHGHKTGFFCDQRENRREASRLAKGRDVLDLCTYTGGFALSASKAGARRVVGVDLDEMALEVARRNARLNRVKVDFLHADLFNYLRQAKEKFDVVILDPPKQAPSREDLPKARRAYHDMNALAMKVVAPGGFLVSCSCSGLVGEEEFLELLRRAARIADREVQILRVAGAGPDHPVSSLYPEGRYLKAVFGRLL
ncbi:MAG: class I SAM-dependent rRNA methyltransferase [Planctomycetes bacterium]|nr:class I SAM-dependent rRNA methyltransferase [Planctomycetota bacterium]